MQHAQPAQQHMVPMATLTCLQRPNTATKSGLMIAWEGGQVQMCRAYDMHMQQPRGHLQWHWIRMYILAYMYASWEAWLSQYASNHEHYA
jgi:hypothetical protein